MSRVPRKAWKRTLDRMAERVGRALPAVSELAAEREEADGQRGSLAADLPTDDLQRYERLRRTKAGTAIALVDNGRVCVSCRMTLTTNVMRQLRDKSRQVSCSACGRILYQP